MLIVPSGLNINGLSLSLVASVLFGARADEVQSIVQMRSLEAAIIDIVWSCIFQRK